VSVNTVALSLKVLLAGENFELPVVSH